MYIVTDRGIRPIRPMMDVVNLDGDTLRVPDSGLPLPHCRTHAMASNRYLITLHLFLRNPRARFLDQRYHDDKLKASVGMIGC